MNHSRILIVEDNEPLREALVLQLQSDYETDSAGDAETAFMLLQKTQYDLIILDINLPRMDGYKFCASLKSLKGYAHVPVIFHSGKSDIEDKLVGFSVGANDFLPKPCDPRELKARIKIQLLSKAEAKKRTEQVDVGPFRFNLIEQKVSYLNGTETVTLDLSTLEFKLLHFFSNHIDHVLTRNQLLDQVWGDSRHVSDRSVDAIISKLRRKMGLHANLLQAVRGQGYRFSLQKYVSQNESSIKRAI